MNKLILVLAFVSIIGLAAASFEEDKDVKSAVKSAYNHGKSVFAGLTGRGAGEQQVAEGDKPRPRRRGPFSHYTAKLGEALGGGKPALFEQYRKHHYVPHSPSVVPRELPPMTKGLTPAHAALRYIPSSPYQFTTDRTRV